MDKTIIMIEGREFDEWELEGKVDTLIEAEKIQADEPLMKYLKPKIEDKRKEEEKEAINSLEALKKKRSELKKSGDSRSE